MKIKNLKKKLALNKNTIAHLNNGQLGRAKGGHTGTCPPTTLCTDDTCDTCSCDTCNTCHKTCVTWLCPVSTSCPEVCS
jgi:hypothetical protein